MAPKTTWQPAHWLSNQTWLLKDNSIVETPPVEVTSSHRRARLAGDTKSVPYSSLDALLLTAVEQIALERATAPWVRLPDKVDDQLSQHAAVAPGYATTPDFGIRDKLFGSPYNHTDIVFEFQSVECPSLIALAWVYLQRQRTGTIQVRSGLTFRHVHETQINYHWWQPGSLMQHPFGYYDQSDEREAAVAWLAALDPAPGVEWVNETYATDRDANTAALKLLRQLVDLADISLPAWRDPHVPEAMKYTATGRTTFTKSLYREMLDTVQTQATVERIQKNLQSITADLSRLGIVTSAGSSGGALKAIEHAAGTDIMCHMVPLTEGDEQPDKDKISVVHDYGHTVSLDLQSGSLIVTCAGQDEDALHRWEYERTKAELTGELDAFLGFTRDAAAKKTRRRFAKIVEQRSPAEHDLEIGKFSTP